MNMDYIKVIDSFVETVNTPILVIDDRSYVISSNIGRLRRALCKNGADDLVRNVRGAGYALG